MRRAVVVVALVSCACSFVGVERRPAVVEATTSIDCTDSYVMPAIDVAVVAALIGYSFYVIHQVEEDCESEDGCDAQAPLAIVAPYFYATPFAFSSLWGARQIGRCRDAKRWQLEQPYFAGGAGEIGQRCIPSHGGSGRCTRSSCVDGMCVDCATPIASLERAGDTAERRQRWHAMQVGCRRLLASTCGALVAGTLTGQPYPEACRFLLERMGASP